MENISASAIFSFLFQGVNAVIEWFQTYILVGDWSLIIFGSIFFYIFARLILAPLFGVSLHGSGLSDSVKEVNQRGLSDSEAQKYASRGYGHWVDEEITVVNDDIPRLGG